MGSFSSEESFGFQFGGARSTLNCFATDMTLCFWSVI